MSETASLHYIAFPTLHETPLTVAARLRLPEGDAGKRPAVIILHGSAGPSGREGGYAKVLNEAGFATLEPDQWAARGLKGGADGRPPCPTFMARAVSSRHIPGSMPRGSA